jgi:hypothetical protein
MAADPTSPRSRRSLLAAAVGAAAATVASALGRPLSVEAADGDVVHVGALHSGDSATMFQVSNSDVALGGHSTSGWGVAGTSATGFGVIGQSELVGVAGESTTGPAVRGRSVEGPGVFGASDTQTGVHAESATYIGVWGESQGPGWPAIAGWAKGGKTGVLGISGPFDWGSVAPAKTGVHGFAAQDSTSIGVKGESGAGTGVRGVSVAGSAIWGTSATGPGVRGESVQGTAMSGVSEAGHGVRGESRDANGVWGSTSLGHGVRGESQDGHGVWGSSSLGHGVKGESGDGTGVWAFSGLGCAVSGLNESSDRAAIIGRNGGNHTGIAGLSEYGPAPSFPTTTVTPAKTGVFGRAAQDSESVGVEGESPDGTGVWGSSSTGQGVRGSSTSGIGVVATSDTASAVSGQSLAVAHPAIRGESLGNSTGVQGRSGAGPLVPSPAKTGVYGYAAQDANARGVTGQTTAGRGLNGVATTGRGVHGEATTGYALRAVGRVRLDKCAGRATILSGTKSIVVTPGIDLVATSAVVATLQGNPSGTTIVKSVAVNTTTHAFTIYLTAAATANLMVAWHVFG